MVQVGRLFLCHLFKFSLTRSRRIGIPTPTATHASPDTRNGICSGGTIPTTLVIISIIQIKCPLHEIWTNESGKKRFSGIYMTHLFSAHVPLRYRKKNINWKEMYAVFYGFLLRHTHRENGEWRITCPLRQRGSSRRNQQAIFLRPDYHSITNPPPHCGPIQRYYLCCLDTHGL